jgi:hypothetical protein
MRLLLFLLLLSNIVFAQQKPKTDCNTIFVCIDSLSYKQLFANSFIKDTLFFCREETTNTTEDQYTGKYAIGKAATLEFFKPTQENKISNHLHDFGIEFKTRKLGDLASIQHQAKKYRYTLDTSTTQLNEQDTILPWYKTLAIKPPKANFELSILEYQAAYLNYLGFTPAAITQSMDFEAFYQQLANGRKYPRQFRKFKSVTLQIGKSKMALVKQFCLLNGMIQKGNSFSNHEFTIYLEIINDTSISKVKAIELELIETQKQHIVQVSDNITISVAKKSCTISF